MIVEWDVAFTIGPADGSLPALPFNTLANIPPHPGSLPVGTGYYLLDPAKCNAGAARRITRNNIAQADGEITHRKFKSGYVAELNVQLWQTKGAGGLPASKGQARGMADLLAAYLEAIANADGQLIWQPSAFPEGAAAPNKRMIDRARSMGPSGQGADSGFVSVVVSKDPEGPLLDVTFALLSPLPYAIDVPLTTSTVTIGGTLNNVGTAAYYPVFRVHGPTTDVWTIVNEGVLDESGNPLEILYDPTLPGASNIPSGHYVEIDCFKNTVYLDDGTNYKAGIDPRSTDFFPLVPGNNLLVVPPTQPPLIECLWRAAWI